MTLEIGSLLYNRYRIDSVIAQGGMGAIYRAYDQSLGVQVALKENLFSSEESLRQFRREATLLAGLRHPNLPRVTDHFTITNQGQYLVMDYIDGEDLRQRNASTGLIREDDAVAIGAAVCSALQYLHTRVPPVVHRDIKPGNIKVTLSGQVYLVDFGLAKSTSPGQATTTGAQALTPGYAPPEQYGQGTTPQSDIYALGATLYATLTGIIPEDGLARAMGSAQLTPLRTHNPQISERTAQVIERAMCVRPEDRYLTADGLRQALLNTPTAISSDHHPRTDIYAAVPLINSADPTLRQSDLALPQTQQFPTVATPQIAGSAPPDSRPVSPKRPMLVWIVLALVAILVVGTSGFFLLQNTSSPVQPTDLPTATLTPAPPATATALPMAATMAATNTAQPSATSTTPPATPTATLTPTSTITATSTVTPLPSLGGGSGQIAFVSIQNGKRPQIWLIPASGGQAKALTQIDDGACQPAWSPNGKKLVFVTPCTRSQDEYAGSTLFMMDADGTNPEPLPSMPGGDFDPAWSPDGTRIAFTSLREGVAHIFVMYLADRKVERLTGAFSDDRRPAWSPDGKRVAFESTRLGTRQIWLMGEKGENPAEFTRLTEGVAFNPVWSGDGSILFYNRDAGLPSIYARRTEAGQNLEARLTDLRPILRPRVSKDGQWIVFEAWTGSNHDIYIMRSTGTNRQALTSDVKLDFDPVWRP